MVLLNILSPSESYGDEAFHGRPGHLPKSVNVFCSDHSDASAGEILPLDAVRQRFRESGVMEPGCRVIAYCGGGFDAPWAFLMHQLGRTDVAVYDGSMLEWAADPIR